MPTLFAKHIPSASEKTAAAFHIRYMSPFVLLGIGLLIAVLAAYGVLIFIANAKNNTLDRLGQDIRAKVTEFPPAEVNEIFLVAERLTQLRQFIRSHIFSTNALRLLESETYPGVRFNDYSFSAADRIIRLQGTADGFTLIARQIALLEGNPHIEKIGFGGLSRDASAVSFSIVITFKQSLTELGAL
ncbi:MAG: hypothetical protein AAB539_02555 [Patescibacteria group bacterium]